uniref:Uncharacterized protein n=1 Tax=Romanomermis culicivorax TaxID=13658 RepID=A0A915KC34_ROMCU
KKPTTVSLTKCVQWTSHILSERRHPVLPVLSAAKRPANEQLVAGNNAINKKLVKRPVNLVHRQLRGHNRRSHLQKQQCQQNKCRLPANQTVTIHARSHTLFMMVTVKKPSSLTLQAMTAAVTMHRNTTPRANKRPRVNKCARCTQLASRKMCTGVVSTDHHQS